MTSIKSINGLSPTLRESFNGNNVPNATRVFVESVKSWFRFDSQSTLTHDGYTVAQPLAGSGRWLRENIPDGYWAQQTVWYIDPINGNDENDGLTSLTALGSGYELGRRWGIGSTITVPVTVNILGTGLVGCAWDVKVNHSGAIYVLGARTQVTTGTISSYTGVVTTYNTAVKAILATSGTNFATQVGKRMRITSGARTDARAVVDADNGGNSCLTTTWLLPTADRFNGNDIQNATPSRVTPQAGDSFEIYTVPQIVGGPLKVECSEVFVAGSGDAKCGFILENLDLGAVSPNHRLNISAGQDVKSITAISINMIRARIYGIHNGLITTSSIMSNMQLFDSELWLLGGNSANVTLVESSRLYLDFDHYKNGAFGFSTVDCALFIGNAADFSPNGLSITYGNYLTLIPRLEVTGLLWGTTGAITGLVMDPGVMVLCRTTPTLKAATNDFILAGIPFTWSQVPVSNPNAQCGVLGI